MAGTGREVERKAGVGVAEVDPHDEPSAEWGWHGGFPRGTVIAGWFTVVALLAMLIGNHEGQTENLWLIGFALLVVLGLIREHRRRRHSWRR